MKQIKVLGSGCTKCVKTAELIEKIASEINVSVNVSKETSPAIVIDEQLVHSGSMPQLTQIKEWLQEQSS
jgi:glutaredoxin